MSKKNVTKVVCPKCGAEMVIPEHEHLVAGMVIGKDSGLGTVYLQTEEDNNNNSNSNKMKNKAMERINALKSAGVDVSNLFAMQGAAGGEVIGKMENGVISVVDDDDPIFQMINKGYVPNHKLFRRFVMGQMFHLLSNKHWYGYHNRSTYTERVHTYGYDYSWKVLIEDLKSQANMWKNRDKQLLVERQMFFNKGVAVAMADEYIKALDVHVGNLKTHRCKGVKYVKLGGKNIFVSDLENKVFQPLRKKLVRIIDAPNTIELYHAVVSLNRDRIHIPGLTQNKLWFDAFKGAGAYYTMQNMLRFHGCSIKNDGGYRLGGKAAENFLITKARTLKGWELFGIMKKFLIDNKVDIDAKIESWRK